MAVPKKFSRREREIMDIVFRLGRATAADVMAEMAEPPSYSSVRSLLAILGEKGHLTHEAEGNRYVWLPTVDRSKARASALDHVVRTFFDDSASEAVSALLESKGLSAKELDELSKMIEDARREGR